MLLRTIAMMLGIIGGISGLIAVLVYIQQSTSVGVSPPPIAYLLVLLIGIAPPIIGIVGAGIVRKKLLLGSGLMMIGSLMMFLYSSFSIKSLFSINFFWVSFVVSAVFFFTGAILGMMGKFQR